MISRVSLNERVQEWGLREDVVEKDYVLGWILWGVGSEPGLRETWVFKGGTCLKKCYIETYRFSEDLDFTVLDDGPIAPDDVLPVLRELLGRVYEASGIDLAVQPPRFRPREGRRAGEGRIYYIGPRATPSPASVKLDLDGEERLCRATEWKPIAHAYDDELPSHCEAGPHRPTDSVRIGMSLVFGRPGNPTGSALDTTYLPMDTELVINYQYLELSKRREAPSRAAQSQ